MKRLWKDKRGSSLAMVLITMTFVTMLAMTIIAMTITNIRLKETQKRSQGNFYNTDSILDTISAGIENESSKISADAYANALSEYNASLTSANQSLDRKYASSYMAGMVDALVGTQGSYTVGVTSYYYSDSVLLSYLDANEQQNYIKHTSGDNILTVEEDSLILKNVSVYKEENTLETTIKTDIRIDIPSVSAEVQSEYLSYAMIADDQIRANSVLSPANVQGSVYAGTVNRYKNDADSDCEEGIIIQSNSKLNISAENIITRGDVAVKDCSSLAIVGSAAAEAGLWAENILTYSQNSTAGNILEINGKAYIADDMEIKGSNDSVALRGQYIGYNYSDDYSSPTATPVTAPDQAQFSSAISINGTGDKIDLSGLKNLFLAGRSFISKKVNLNETRSDNPDIKLGESLTVKASQLAYLVPSKLSSANATDSFVWTMGDMQAKKNASGSAISYSAPSSLPARVTVRDFSGNTTEWFFFEIDGTEYAFDCEGFQDYLLEGCNNKAAIAARMKLLQRLNQKQPLVMYRRSGVANQLEAASYFYLNFATDKDSAEFYKAFADSDSALKVIYDSVNNQYVDVSSVDSSRYGIKLEDGSGNMPFILSSGNILYNAAVDKTNLSVLFKNDDVAPGNALGELAVNSNIIYMSKELALIDDFDEAKDLKDGGKKVYRLKNDRNYKISQTVDGNLKDVCYSKSGIDYANPDTVVRTNLFDRLVDRKSLPTGNTPKSFSNGAKAYVQKGNVSWDVAGKGLIITEGNVNITANFTGLIIAGGDINITGGGGITIQSDEKMVKEILDEDKNGAGEIYNLLSKYFRKSVDATIGGGEINATGNVNYENWKKN